MKIKVFEAREKRRVSRVSGRELSRRTGLAVGTINNIENEKTSPTMNNMEKIAEALNTDIEELYDPVYKRKG